MMRSRVLAVIAAAGFCMMVGSASAQSFSDADRARVEARISQLDAVISGGDLTGALEVVPPLMLQTIAERTGTTEAALVSAMREMIRIQLGDLTIVDYDMDLAAAVPTLTTDGSRTYLLIPTQLVMLVPDGRRFRVRSNTLAFEDGDDWYLVRVQEPSQVALVRELWPAFVDVEFPAGVTEAVD